MTIKLIHLTRLTLPLLVVWSITSHAAPVKDMPLKGISTTPNSSFSDYRGSWIYVDFWASWCGPCKKSFPYMVKLQNKFKKNNLKVIAISVDEEEQDALKFLKDTPANFSVYHDPQGTIATQFQLPGMPSSYLVDPKGNVVSKHVGFRDTTALEITNELTEIFKR